MALLPKYDDKQGMFTCPLQWYYKAAKCAQFPQSVKVHNHHTIFYYKQGWDSNGGTKNKAY